MKKSILFLAAILLISTLMVLSHFFNNGSNGVLNSVAASGKSKWQKLLEKKGIDQSLWEKYLPNVKHGEYSKAIKKYQKSLLSATGVNVEPASNENGSYPIHKNISTTLFWVGEEAGKDNKNISNCPSAWDDKWVKHFGGVDDPDKRNGYDPAKFTPAENPFYFALPYNDFDNNGNRKKEVLSLAPWAGEKNWDGSESLCKNRWIKITHGDKIVYAQWQDVGPFGEDDQEYVFGSARPKSKTNDRAGLDVSPAVNDYLSLSDIDNCDWQFVEENNVPEGPWKKIVTKSNVYWE